MAATTARITFVLVAILCVSYAHAVATKNETKHDHSNEIKCSAANANTTCPEGCSCIEKVCGNTTVFNTTKDSHKAHNACKKPEDPVCFPAGATVVLASGIVARMDALRVGDRVLSAPGVYSEVLMFTHALSKGEYAGHFVQLTTASGAALRLTAGHLLEAAGKLVRADAVAVGDALRLADGSLSAVVEKIDVADQGLYNPQTAHGNVVVDGIVASTYTDALTPPAAHALLAPVRSLFIAARSVGLLLSGAVQSAFV